VGHFSFCARQLKLVKVDRKGIVGQDRLLGSALKTKGGFASDLSRRVRKCFVVESMKCENGTASAQNQSKGNSPKERAFRTPGFSRRQLKLF